MYNKWGEIRHIKLIDGVFMLAQNTFTNVKIRNQIRALIWIEANNYESFLKLPMEDIEL
jgi:hypothetical protein